MEFHSEVGHKFKDRNVITKNPKVPCSHPKAKLRDFLMSDKPALLYADFHHEIVRNAGHGLSKSSGRQQIHGTRIKANDDKMVKHISKFPSNLEKGKSFQETPMAVTLDWMHLEKLYKHNPMPTQNNSHSPSTSSSSYFSTDGSSSHSSRGNISSPSHQGTHRSPSQSHLEALPPVKNYIQDECYLRKGSCTPVRQRAYHAVPLSHHLKDYPLPGHFEDVNSSRRNAASVPSHMLRGQKLYGLDQNCATNRSGIRLGAFERKVSDISAASDLGKQQKTGNLILAFSVKGKMRVQENELKQERKQSHDHEPNLGDCNPNCSKERQASVLLLRDPSLKSKSSHFSDSSFSDYKVPGEQRLKSLFQEDDVKVFQTSDFCSSVSYSCPLPSTDDNGYKKSELRESCSVATTQGVNVSHHKFTSPSRSRNPVDMRLITGLKNSSPLRPGSESTVKVRQPSPIRRLSSAVGSFIRSAGSRDNSPLRRSSSKDSLAKLESDRTAASISLDESYTDTSQANSRAKSSPLRRLLDPLLKSKASNAHEVAQPFKKSSDEHLVIANSTFDSGRTKCAKDSHRGLKQGSSFLQALLQVSSKNGHPLFTFAVDNNSDILAATLKKLSAPERNSSSWIYTFFTVHEMKKKNGSWLNHGTKGNGHSYVPNVIAQMKVSNPQVPIDTWQKGTDDVNLREFTLFSVDTGQVDQDTTEFQPTDELAAIVAKIVKPESGTLIDPSHTSSSECSPERSMDSGDTLQDRCSIRSQSLLSTTVILPGGVHTIPSKGSLSTLTQRWRSGGSCDCGGWDEGCQLRIFNQGECENSSSSLETAIALDEFKLFSQEGQETQLVLRLKPYKDRIYSVEFHPSISLLQAFGTSVAVLDCKSSSGHFSDSNVVQVRASAGVISDDPFRTKVINQSQGEAPGGHVSYPPPHSPFGRV